MKKIYIDGAWGIGKSTLCNFLAEGQHLTYINEPVFPVKISSANFSEEIIEKWYLNAHLRNVILANEISADVVLERSMVSALTYSLYYQKRIEHHRNFIENYLKLNTNSVFILLDFNYVDYLVIRDQFEDYRKPLVRRHAGLIEGYEKVFSSIMSSYLPHQKYYRIKSLDRNGYINIETMYKEIVNFI